MPPWLPEPGHGVFAGERRLTDDEIDILRRWEAQGAPEGNRENLLPPPPFVEGWRLGQPDLVVKMPRPYALAARGGDVWRNFVIPIDVPSARYVRTVELRPGSARVVHHALMAVDGTASSRRRDERDAEPGFEGMDMGDSHAPDGHLLGWTPGMTPFPGVPGQAWRLDPGTDLVLQLHLIPSGKPEAVDPAIGLYFAEREPVGPPLHLMRLDADQAIDIPPGSRDFAVTDRFEVPVAVDVLAVYPHAHFLARTVEAKATRPDGTEEWLLRIDAWDFKWQDVYRYERPVSLPRGTIIDMRFTFDNSADNPRNPNQPPKRVVAGMRSVDEMAHLQLQVRPHQAGDELILKEALNRHTIQKEPGNAWAYYELGNALRDQGRLAEAILQYRSALARDPAHAVTHNNLGVLLAEGGDPSAAIDHYVQALQAAPDLADGHYNLGNALRAAGRLEDAAGHYREALRLEPGLGAALNNLGEILASQGRLAEATEEFRGALRSNPDSAEAHNNLGAALGMQGRLDEAIEHFRRALSIEPDHAGARENLRIALESAAPAGLVRP